MSHFVVYVFGDKDGFDIEELLEPYYEGKDMDKYIEYTKEQAIAYTRKEIEDYKNGSIYQSYISDPEKYKAEHSDYPGHINYLENVFPEKLKWNDEECYNDIAGRYDEDMIDEDGNLYSTYNPESKWDWYEIGGRWDGGLVTKTRKEVNEAHVADIDWDKTEIPFAFVTPDGEWHERGQMGWCGIVSNAQETDNWEKEFKEALENYADCDVVLVDCHI